MKRIAIFASGNGSNAENIIQYFKSHQSISVSLVLSNNPSARVLKRASNHSVDTYTFDRSQLLSKEITNVLKKACIDMIILSGFILKIPINIIRKYPNKIINIHPSLLPLYGGKGMYGMHVHEKVIANCEKETGITIHYVNKNYDEGAIIFQKSFLLSQNETATSLADKIHDLEYKYFPRVIEQLLTSKVKIN